MSVLAILLEPRTRSSAGDAAAGEAPGPGYAYVFSPDGTQQGRHGHAPAALLPRADSVVVVLDEADVGWQRITLPKANAARLRAALGGAIEEHLLEDDGSVHLALAPGAHPGAPAWVAVLHKPWLRAELDKLEGAGLAIERVLPRSWPLDAPHGHFHEARSAAGEHARVRLSHAGPNGVTVLRLEGSLARSLLAHGDTPAGWSAEPAVAAAAEHWLGAPVALRTEAEHVVRALHSPWNLRQFDLAPSRRGARALRTALRQLLSPAWRPARAGVALLLLVQLVGINAWAWQQRQALAGLRAAQDQLLRASFPQVRAVLDAPAQMQRETDVLRASAGRAGGDDLETLLGAAAAAWPDGAAPVHTLRFEPGRLSLGAPGLDEPQRAQLRERLRLGGWALDSADARLTLSRAGAAGSRP